MPSTSPAFDPKMLCLHTSTKSRTPVIEVPHDAGMTVQLVVFDRPDPRRMQYLSLSPISLTLGDKRGDLRGVTAVDWNDKEEGLERKRKEVLIEKLKLHTVIKHSRTPKELALGVIINQINCCAEIDGVMQSNVSLIGVRQKRSMSVTEQVAEKATNLLDSFVLLLQDAFDQHIRPVAIQVIALCIISYRILAEGVLNVLDWRPMQDSAALKDISATAQQVDIRLEQFCYWPTQYVTLHRRRTDWESITNSHPEYIRFFNSLWLVANDVILGIAIGSYIMENASSVAAQVDKMTTIYSIEGLQHMITWLMDWPAGLKLNNDLAKFLGDLFLWVIKYWDGCIQTIRPSLPNIIRLLGISSFAGASLPIAMLSDLISIFTLHIYCFYIASARIYNWQLTVIISLFHLFRGKKRNVLRNRIDSCDYDLDQLLLGTILFTLLFFLLPTVAVFYAAFAGARIAIIALKAALDTWLACLNHFPLFALMLRVKDSRRLPGGIRFELNIAATSTTGTPGPATSHIKLHSVPLPLSETFTQYAQLGQRLRKHYLSPRVFLCLLSGQFVPPIHRKNLYSLQYSMLPVQRVGIKELWALLKQEERKGMNGAMGMNGNSVAPNGTGRTGWGGRR